MQDLRQYVIDVLDGPSVFAPYPALVSRFSYESVFSVAPAEVPIAFIEEIQEILEVSGVHIRTGVGYHHLGELIAEITASFQSTTAPWHMQSCTSLSERGQLTIVVEYFSPHVAVTVLRNVVDIIARMWSGNLRPGKNLENKLVMIMRVINGFDPFWNNRSMLSCARKMGVPTFPVGERMRLFCYGQGSNSRVFLESANDLDSFIGQSISTNKYSTIELLGSLGYPVPRQRVINSRDSIAALAAQLGYPVVLKPLVGSKGAAVTCNIRNQNQLMRVYDEVFEKVQGGMLIESHIDGYDHRLTVACGELVGANLKKPPLVTGDGVSSVKQLIDHDNASRPSELKEQGLLNDIVIDSVLAEMLRMQGMSLESIPEEGQEIRLRTNANLATGGTIENVFDSVHADNIRLAVDVARNMRMDVIGIDYITTDISRSWREEGAIIEVNYAPGVMHDTAERLLASHFRTGDSCRIRSSLYISDHTDLDEERPDFDLTRRNAGFTNSHQTLLNGVYRRLKSGGLLQRTRALLMDPACNEIAVVMSLDEIMRRGLPQDRFDMVYIDKNLLKSHQNRIELEGDGRCRSFLENHCQEIVSY